MGRSILSSASGSRIGRATIRAGGRHYSLAWGHGGQHIALVPDLDMVVVLLADPLYREHGARPWRLEKANLNLVADFIASLPKEDR